MDTIELSKICRTCRTRLPYEHFELHPSMRDGRRNECADCRAIKKAEEYQTKKVEICKKLREDRSDNHEKYRDQDLKKKFKISIEQFTEMLAAQGNCCLVCKTTTPGGAYNQWHVDHDHSCCGQENRKKTCGNCIRGILCSNCNLALGTAKDSSMILRALADYLDAYELHKIFKD